MGAATPTAKHPEYKDLLARFQAKIAAIPAECREAMGWLYVYRQLQEQRKRLGNRALQMLGNGRRVFWANALAAEVAQSMGERLAAAAEKVHEQEREAEKQLRRLLMPTDWYRSVAVPAARGEGISKNNGALSAAKLLWAFGSASRFSSFGRIVRYAGLAPENGRAPRPRRGVRINFSPAAWQALFDLSECWLRMPNGYWRNRWDALKAVAAEQHPDWPANKVHAWGRRRVLREFLRDLWETWQEWETAHGR